MGDRKPCAHSRHVCQRQTCSFTLADRLYSSYFVTQKEAMHKQEQQPAQQEAEEDAERVQLKEPENTHA